MTDWDKVLAATDAHNIDTIDTHLDGRQSFTYIRCTCGNEPDREAFTEPWEFTDHIRRLVFDALCGPADRLEASVLPPSEYGRIVGPPKP